MNAGKPLGIRRFDGVRLRQNGFLLLFLTYILIASAGLKFHERREIFPFFSWSLFTFVTDKPWRYEIEISRIDDTLYDPPANYYDLSNVFPQARARSSNVWKAAASLAQATAKELPSLAQVRTTFENRYLSGTGSVDYRVVIVIYDPLERLRSGETLKKIEIAAYTKGNKP